MAEKKLAVATRAAFTLPSEGDSLSGLKLFIGVGLVLASHNLDALNDVALLLPDLSVIETARHALEQGVVVGERVLEFLGSGFMTVGILDKIRKFFKGLFS